MGVMSSRGSKRNEQESGNYYITEDEFQPQFV